MSQLVDPDALQDLLNINPDDHEEFSWNENHFLAKPSDVYDGDTFTATWIYNDEVIKQRCRCIGYNSPEIRPRRNLPNRDQIKLEANLAKDRFTELLNQDALIVVECFRNDSFGRMLTVVYNATNGTKSLNQIMLDEGHGIVYVGGKHDPTLSDALANDALIATCPR
jgi:endonuclease YncB( thermonuclease family)